MEEDMPSTKLNETRRKIGYGASLPHDMIVEVLQWLPVESVLRFHAVCRSWAALLSSDEFRTLHMAAASRAPPKLLYISPTAGFESTAVYSCHFSPPSSSDRGNLLFTIDGARGNCLEAVTPAACRGLTLLYDAVTTAYYICNAATRAATRLPRSTDKASRSAAGLGFDARTKEYKVVRLINGMCSDKVGVRCEVYTPGGGYGDRWRPVAGGVPADLRPLVGSAVMNASLNKLPPVFANGSLHWLMDPTARGVAVVSFSVTEETFACIRSPPFWVPGTLPTDSRWASGEHLVEMDGRLCLVSALRNRDTLEIWQLPADYRSGEWSLNHRINLSGELGTDLLEPQMVRVIGSFGNFGSSSRKKIVIATSNHKIDNEYEKKVHTYDPKSEALETILSMVETHSSPRYERPSSRFSLFEETLAPVYKTNEEIQSSSPWVKATREILLRLPARSAVRSKLVCKQWLRMIENENFVDSYSKRKNMDRRPNVMLVGKGTGRSGFSFAPLDICLPAAPSNETLLDTKVVCSKPCHGLNLVSIETADYLCNPCTGFYRGYANLRPNSDIARRMPREEEHAFTVGNKNVGLTFDPSTREHAVVELFYDWKDFESRSYYLRCALRWCGSRNHSFNNSPPLPVNDMPPAYVDGLLYWMSEPRLGPSHEWAIISYDIVTKIFGVIACPSWFARRHSRNHCRAFVVELAGVLCAVLADPAADNLDVWKLEHGQWSRAYTIHLKACPDYSVKANVVVPLAVDPDGGRILLNTGRRIGLYHPLEQKIQDLCSLDQMPVDRSKPQRDTLDVPSTSSENSLTSSVDLSGEVINIMDTSSIPFVPMVYEESLAYYSRMAKLNYLW